MAENHSSETVHTVRMLFIKAARGLIIQVLTATPTPGHRLWAEIVWLARIGRTLARANDGHLGPRQGPAQEWDTLPKTYLERCSQIGPDAAARQQPMSEKTSITLAEQILMERRPLLSGLLPRPGGGD